MCPLSSVFSSCGPAFFLMLVCFLLMAIGLIVARKPLQKKCDSSPDEKCACKGTCEKESTS